jgi:peroxiredoxin
MKNITLLFIAITALTLSAFKLVDSTSKPTEDVAPKGYAIGDEASDFRLLNIDDQMVSLADYPDAKGFIVTFTCNHCPYAVAYEQRIMNLDAKYASLGYPVIAISPNDPALVPEDGMDEMKKLASSKGYTFPYLLDEKQDVYPLFGATKTPHIFILHRENGKNIVKYIAAIDNKYANPDDVTERYVEDAVDALIAGTEIKLTTTKAIGCSIKDSRKKK